MAIDYCDEVGWPAVATSVRVDTSRIFPALRTEERRMQMKLAEMRYREKVGWPKRDRERMRQIEADYRARKREEKLRNRRDLAPPYEPSCDNSASST